MAYRTGYEKIRTLATALEAFELRPSKKSEKAFLGAKSAYLSRIHRPRSAKSKKKAS